MNKLIIPSLSGSYECAFGEVIRIEGSSSYSKIFTSTRSRPLVVPKVLAFFEDALPGELFARVHRSHLVNKTFIAKINDDLGCGTRLILSTGDEIMVSRRKKSAFLKSWADDAFNNAQVA